MFSRCSYLMHPFLCSRLHASALYFKSHYDILGVTPHATQNDIKTAYYKMSMLYHPDKNKNSPEASKKFRDITTAYEVLGNYRLRKLYDKGIIHIAGEHFTNAAGVATEDDDETKFYKSRAHRHKPPVPTGRTPIYNFDEWSQAHYGATFARREATKEKYYRRKKLKQDEVHDIQTESVVWGVGVAVTAFFFFTYISSESYDVDTIKKEKSEQ